MSQLLQAGLNVTAIGMSVVFVLLTLLVFVIRGMSALTRAIDSAFPALPEPAAAVSASPTGHELVSVISAAIAAHRRKQ
jgi:sodium pump decarboxylase gamma subunit